MTTDWFSDVGLSKLLEAGSPALPATPLKRPNKINPEFIMSNSNMVQIEVHQSGERLDHYLTLMIPHLSRSQIKKLISRKDVLVSGEPTKAGAILQAGNVVSVQMPPELPTRLLPEAIPFQVVYEDDQIIVVNKAAGVVVHPAHGHSTGTLVNGLIAAYPDLQQMTQVDSEATFRPGIVHRLDQDTSGLLVIARTPPALDHLRQQFKARSVEKTYLVLVDGHPAAPEGVIDVPVGRNPKYRQRFAAHPEGKPARTHYQVRETFADYSLLEVGLETGRTHQIRVHLTWLNCPVVGDTVYGRRRNKSGLSRQFLHAWRLFLDHPADERRMAFEAPLPDDLAVFLTQLSA
jgi:23S rRNA pseudouridine1911/1915/1917 synthase